MARKRIDKTKPRYKDSKIKPGDTVSCQHCHGQFVAAVKDQQVCGFMCAFEWYQSLGNKSRATARAVSWMVGRKSMAEVEFDCNHAGLPYEYEPDTLTYTPTVRESKYTPDYRFKKKKGGFMYVEFKGVLDLKTRKLLLDIKKTFPQLDLRLVFKRKENFIRKGSKTTYYDWAVKAGFKVSTTNVMPDSWIKEIMK